MVMAMAMVVGMGMGMGIVMAMGVGARIGPIVRMLMVMGMGMGTGSEGRPTHLEHVEAEVDVEGPHDAAEHAHGREHGVLPHPELVLGKLPIQEHLRCGSPGAGGEGEKEEKKRKITTKKGGIY